MEAIVYRGPNKFELEEVEKPTCPKDGVLIKVESVGLCGSDIRTFESGHSKVTPPHIIGHEVVGIVEEVGEEEKGFSPGDRVALNPVNPCDVCYYCTNGLENHCKDITVIGSQIPGGYAQYIAIPHTTVRKKCVYKIHDDLNLDHAPLAETLASVHSTQEYVNIKQGDVVVIIGAGPLGNLHAAMAKARGAKKVIISEMSNTRLEMAKRFSSIDVFVDPSIDSLLDIVLRETEGYGADVVITACPVGAAQEQAINLVKPRGKILFFGGLPKDKSKICIDSNIIHYKEIAIFGGYAYNASSFEAALEIITENKIAADQFITHVLPLREIKKGIDIIKSGTGIKVILKPWQ